jgi:hypothetical protein
MIKQTDNLTLIGQFIVAISFVGLTVAAFGVISTALILSFCI